MTEPLTDPLALQLLDHFRRQPYEVAHLMALRDRLEEIGRGDVRAALEDYNDEWVAVAQERKRKKPRRDFGKWLRMFKTGLSVTLSEIL